MFQLNNKSITLNIMFAKKNKTKKDTEKMKLSYISKLNFNCGNKVILLMIKYSEKCYYLATKALLILLRGIKMLSWIVLTVFIHLERKKKLKPHENVCKNLDYYHIAIAEKDNIIFKYNHREKSMEVPFPIYADRESLLN